MVNCSHGVKEEILPLYKSSFHSSMHVHHIRSLQSSLMNNYLVLRTLLQAKYHPSLQSLQLQTSNVLYPAQFSKAYKNAGLILLWCFGLQLHCLYFLSYFLNEKFKFLTTIKCVSSRHLKPTRALKKNGRECFCIYRDTLYIFQSCQNNDNRVLSINL